MTTEEKLDMALDMLAYWCALVDTNGTGWDDWDEGYKDCYRQGPLTEEIQVRIKNYKDQFNDYSPSNS